MIPRAHIIEWGSRLPWPLPIQVEQDLLLSRLMVEIASDQLLGGELALRGGTGLHKLHLPRPLRYSEDLDYVRTTRSPVGPFVDRLRILAGEIGLIVKAVEIKQRSTTVMLTAEPTEAPGLIRIKIEINILETASCRPLLTRPFQVSSSWWSGRGEILTFDIEEMFGTKLRALYQRNKGRDLFDLWIGLTQVADLRDEAVMAAFHHYMADRAFSLGELDRNLAGKLANPDFRADLSNLTAKAPTEFNLESARALLLVRLGRHLDGGKKIG